jgi:hypothetical protein
VEYAEAFHYIGPAPGSRGSRLEDYIKRNAVPVK